MLLQLEEGIVPWGEQQGADPIQHISLALGIDEKLSEKMGLTHRKEMVLPVDPCGFRPRSNHFLSKEPRGVSFWIQMQVEVSPPVLECNEDGGVLVQTGA